MAGSGTVGAPQPARMAIESGLADVVVFYFTINLSRLGSGGAYSFHVADPAKASLERRGCPTSSGWHRLAASCAAGASIACHASRKSSSVTWFVIASRSSEKLRMPST